MSYARVAGELVLNEKSDDLSRASTCLRYGFGNILRTLAHAGEEDTRCRRFYRSELRVSLCEEVVCVHGSCELCCERTRALVGFDSSGKDKENCTQLVFYRFKDSLAAHRAQCKVGIHIALVYGDYTKELGALAEALDVEPLFVE